MPTKHSRRGRPKGSGLDDSGHISAIAALIEQNPELKPTTAIKSLGISDPSTIRRLRDKYRVFTAKTKQDAAELLRQSSLANNATQKAPMLNPTNASVHHQGSRTSRQPRTQKQSERSADLLGEPARWSCKVAETHPESTSTTVDRQAAASNNPTSSPLSCVCV